MTLPPIPVIDAREGGVGLIARTADARMHDLLGAARRQLTPPVVAVMDAVSRRWLERSANPFRREIDMVAGIIGRSGAYALNMSYEWGCTTGVGEDRGGVRMLRVLDWRFHGLGRNLVAARQRGPAGDFVNLTWPGYVGVVTAAAPGRFAAAINQPPMLSWGATLPLDWIIGRARVWRSKALPPAHVLRQAFETCVSYDDAKRLLCEAPLCSPAFFVLAGMRRGEGCIIERLPERAAVREMPAAIANHWVAAGLRGRPRGRHSRERLAQMDRLLAAADTEFMPTPPIINRDTRLVAMVDLAAGRMRLQGWERDGPATAELAIDLNDDP